MLKSKLLKYVAGPQTFAYMPPVLAGAAIMTGMILWMMGLVLGFGVIPGLLVAIGGGAASAVAGFRDPHISSILLCRNKFNRKTPGYVPTKGNHYVA